MLDVLYAELSQARVGFLQSWAAIDYLLLLHHLGCEEFPPMCCFNITGKSYNVSHFIEDIWVQVSKIWMPIGLFNQLGDWGPLSKGYDHNFEPTTYFMYILLHVVMHVPFTVHHDP